MTSEQIQQLAPFPEGYVLRRVESGDYDKGVLSVLENLTVVGEVSRDQFEQFVEYANNPIHNKYVLVVECVGAIDGSPAEQTGQIAAIGTLFVEQKLIHGFGSVAHIEDITVSKQHQGRRIGQQLIRALLSLAEQHKVYKTLLNCSDGMKQYYEHMGFSHAGHMMTKRYRE